MITEYKIVCNGIKKKVIYHFSDSHLTEFDDLCTEEETEKAKKQAEAWERVRAEFARIGREPYNEYEKRSPAEHFCSLLDLAGDGDALVLAGDTLDYFSSANIRFVNKHLSAFPKPFISVCGNHEKREAFDRSGILSPMKEPVQVCDLGDVQIIGVDNSTRSVSEEQNKKLISLLENGKKAIIVIHVPIMCDSNADKLKKSGVYYQFNYEGCPKENDDFINIIESYSNSIIMVLAGHLHYSNYAVLKGNVPQFVSSQGIVGDVNRYVIGEENEL